MEEGKTVPHNQKKKCKNCGAELTYKPGTTSITCAYCQHEEAIVLQHTDFEELELYPYLEKLGKSSHSEQITMLKCNSCGANQHIEENYKSLHCVYCSSPLIREDTKTEEWILPKAILPFQIDNKKAHLIFKKWVKGIWFAPDELKKASLEAEQTKGLYLPFWTFDAQLYAEYIGSRGEHYYTTESYRDSDGKRRTRQVRKTRWYPTSGSVSGFVDDTLVIASKQKKESIPSKIKRWDLSKLQPFHSSFLAGFVTEKYTIPLIEGHIVAKDKAKEIAYSWARRDIGGDEQRVNSLDMQLTEETFKHILLPVYISSYRYKNKKFSFYINGETGVISGERPYSVWKIAFTILLVLTVIAVVFFLSN